MTDLSTVSEGFVAEKARGRGCFVALGVCLVVCLCVVGFSFWWFTHSYRIAATDLSVPEEQVLEGKVTMLREAKETREVALAEGIVITEREINGVVSDQEEYRERLYFDLKPGGVELRMNVEVPEGFPVMSGKRVRLHARLDVALVDSAMVVRLRSASVGGFSVPNAWVGGMKNKDLLEAFFPDNVVLGAFVRGLKEFEIGEDGIRVVPSE